MIIQGASSVDRYSAAHEHFSSGFSLSKIILLLVLAGVFGLFIYFAVRKK